MHNGSKLDQNESNEIPPEMELLIRLEIMNQMLSLTEDQRMEIATDYAKKLFPEEKHLKVFTKKFPRYADQARQYFWRAHYEPEYEIQS